MRKTVDTRPLFLLGRKRPPRAYKGLGTRLNETHTIVVLPSNGEEKEAQDGIPCREEKKQACQVLNQQ